MLLADVIKLLFNINLSIFKSFTYLEFEINSQDFNKSKIIQQIASFIINMLLLTGIINPLSFLLVLVDFNE